MCDQKELISWICWFFYEYVMHCCLTAYITNNVPCSAWPAGYNITVYWNGIRKLKMETVTSWHINLLAPEFLKFF
jgi:hypothetical protein